MLLTGMNNAVGVKKGDVLASVAQYKYNLNHTHNLKFSSNYAKKM